MQERGKALQAVIRDTYALIKVQPPAEESQNMKEQPETDYDFQTSERESEGRLNFRNLTNQTLYSQYRKQSDLYDYDIELSQNKNSQVDEYSSSLSSEADFIMIRRPQEQKSYLTSQERLSQPFNQRHKALKSLSTSSHIPSMRSQISCPQIVPAFNPVIPISQQAALSQFRLSYKNSLKFYSNRKLPPLLLALPSHPSYSLQRLRVLVIDAQQLEERTEISRNGKILVSTSYNPFPVQFHSLTFSIEIAMAGIMKQSVIQCSKGLQPSKLISLKIYKFDGLKLMSLATDALVVASRVCAKYFKLASFMLQSPQRQILFSGNEDSLRTPTSVMRMNNLLTKYSQISLIFHGCIIPSLDCQSRERQIQIRLEITGQEVVDDPFEKWNSSSKRIEIEVMSLKTLCQDYQGERKRQVDKLKQRGAKWSYLLS